MKVFSFAVALAVFLAGPAQARIVTQKSIAGVHLGESPAKVRAHLGKPKQVKTATNTYGAYTQFFYKGLQIDFQGNAKATFVATTRKNQKTAAGVGPGSKRSKLTHKVKGVNCPPAGDGICQLGTVASGKRVTLFEIVSGRVHRVSIGVVL